MRRIYTKYLIFIGLFCGLLAVSSGSAFAREKGTHATQLAFPEFAPPAQDSLYSIQLATIGRDSYRVSLQFLESKPTAQYPHALFKLKIRFASRMMALHFFDSILNAMNLSMVAVNDTQHSPRSRFGHVMRFEATRHVPPFDEQSVGIRASLYSDQGSTSPIPEALLLDKSDRPVATQPPQPFPQFLQIYVDSSKDDARLFLEILVTKFHLTHAQGLCTSVLSAIADKIK